MVVDFTGAFTRMEAKAMQDEYKRLIGNVYDAAQKDWSTIKDVAIVPFEKLNKYIFAWFYSTGATPSRALDFYQSPHFDVVVIALSTDGRSYGFKSLGGYLNGESIPMDVILALQQNS